MAKASSNIDTDRITQVVTQLFGSLMARDEAILDREQKLREKAIDIMREVIEKRPDDQLLNMMQAIVKEASIGIQKIVDLKKLEAMSFKAGKPEKKKAGKTASL